MTAPADLEVFSNLRREMVFSQLRGRGIRDERVLHQMLRVPRHEFAPEKYRDQSYEDHPLPIGSGQTISQPFMVATMLEALSLAPRDKALEIGTGSGYQTALLAELTAEVISIERHAFLADRARETLLRLGYSNVNVITADGTHGFGAEAPYDAIVVSAAAPEVPYELVSQLAEGGRLIIPVGTGDAQQLELIVKRNGQPHTSFRELCRFVPLVSGNGL